MTNTKFKIAIIGCGNMGGAIASAVASHETVTVYDVDRAKINALQKRARVKSADLRTVVETSSIVILAVKPQQFDELLENLSRMAIRGKLFISIAAGIRTLYIEKRLGADARVVRTMPNLPAQVKQGVTAIAAGKSAAPRDLKTTEAIFSRLGKVIAIEEDLMNAVTALSGSGPAYVFLFVECLIEAGQAIGLNAEAASTLARQTLKGSLALLEKFKDDPAALRARVTSKGGTTQAALDVFESKKIRQIFKDALKAAKTRAKELSK